MNQGHRADAEPAVLSFPDRKEDGRFPVRDADGTPVAHILVKWTGTTFSATDADDRPLCEASVGRSGLSNILRANGPDRRALLSVKKSWTGTSAEITLERGGTFVLRGSPGKRDFTVTNADSATVVSAVSQTSVLSFHPHDYVVQQAEPVFNLAELVALVQIWRMVKKAEVAGA